MSDFHGPVTARDLGALHETFVVYGDPDAPYWFLGLEENVHPAAEPSIDGFVRGLAGSARRFREAGRLGLDDLCGSGSRTGYQTTWGAYVKLLFAIERAGSERDTPWTLEEVRRYQRDHLGALDVPAGLPRACLMELFALARDRRRPWPYGELAGRDGLGYLASAERYEAHVGADRTAALLRLVDEHAPSVVMCFGDPCRDVLRPRLDLRTEKIALEAGRVQLPVRLADRGATTIAFARHPAAPGTPDAYWASLGRALAGWRRGAPTREVA